MNIGISYRDFSPFHIKSWQVSAKNPETGLQLWNRKKEQKVIYIIICQSVSVCPYAIYSPSFGQIWTLKVPMDSLGPGGGNKTICKVMGPEMKKKILLETPFLILLPTYHYGILPQTN